MIMIPELTRMQWILIAVAYIAIVIISRISIGILRKREWFLSTLLLLVLSAGAAYALSYYRRIHAPEIISEKAAEITNKIKYNINHAGKQADTDMHTTANGYTMDNFEESSIGVIRKSYPGQKNKIPEKNK